MTTFDKLPTLFDSGAVGFNKLFDELFEFQDQFTKCKFPAYNLKRFDDGIVQLELAVAGYAKDELEVETFADKIVVRGQNHVTQKEEGVDLDRSFFGIAARKFERVFPVAGKFEIESVELENGILKISVNTNFVEPETVKHDIVIK